MFARFDENPAMTLQDIKKTKRYGRTDAHTDAHTHARTDNVKTVYPTTNKVCGGYNNTCTSCVFNGFKYITRKEINSNHKEEVSSTRFDFFNCARENLIINH